MVVAVGYGPNYIALRNSWGPLWGDNGDFYVSDKSAAASCSILADDGDDCEYIQMVRVSVLPMNEDYFEPSITVLIGSILYLPILGAAILILINHFKRNLFSFAYLLFPIVLIVTMILRTIWLFLMKMELIAAGHLFDGFSMCCFMICLCSFMTYTSYYSTNKTTKGSIIIWISVSILILYTFIASILRFCMLDTADHTSSSISDIENNFGHVFLVADVFDSFVSLMPLLSISFWIFERLIEYYSKLKLVIFGVFTLIMLLCSFERAVSKIYYRVNPPISEYLVLPTVLSIFIPDVIPLYYAVWYTIEYSSHPRDYQAIN